MTTEFPATQSEQKPPSSDFSVIIGRIDQIMAESDAARKGQMIKQLIDERLAKLLENCPTREVSLMSRPCDHFLRPESTIRRSFLVDPFHLDDPDIYPRLFDMISEIKSLPAWAGQNVRAILPSAILGTINEYFGNYCATDDTESKSQRFYLEHSTVDSPDISLKDLKGQKIAVCSEKAGTAQNLLHFVGIDAILMTSSKCQLSTTGGPDATAHVYNLLRTPNGYFIFDPTNPGLIKDSNGKTINYYPAIYKISEDEYAAIMAGGTTEVEHKDLVRREDGSQEVKLSKRIYGGSDYNYIFTKT